jgi:hypothetical protein
MPTRLPPVVYYDKHDIPIGLDSDWTLCPDDQGKEYARREARNVMLKEALLEGRSVCYRSSGWSLWPKIHSNDQTTYDPVTAASAEIQVGEVVFCQVQPGNRFYAHLVLRQKWDSFSEAGSGGEWRYFIGNMKKCVNGWCHLQHIYGRLVDVEH